MIWFVTAREPDTGIRTEGLRTVEDAQHDYTADFSMAGRRPESGLSAERSQLYENVLRTNPGKAIDSKGVSKSLFLYCRQYF